MKKVAGNAAENIAGNAPKTKGPALANKTKKAENAKPKTTSKSTTSQTPATEKTSTTPSDQKPIKFIKHPPQSYNPLAKQTQTPKKKPENTFKHLEPKKKSENNTELKKKIVNQTIDKTLNNHNTNSGTTSNTTKSEIPNTSQSSSEMSSPPTTSTTVLSTTDQTSNELSNTLANSSLNETNDNHDTELSKNTETSNENVTEKNEPNTNINNSQQNSINPNPQLEKDNLEPMNEIPTPPPLPSSLLTSPKKNSSDPITPELLEKKNLKPQIPPNTIITPDTLADTIPDQIVLEELKGRQIIKDDENIKPEVRLLTENNEIITIGKNNFPVKLTPKGHGYLFSSDKEQEIPHNLPADSSEIEIKLGILKQPDDAFLLHGKQTHILVAIIHNKNETDTFDYGLFSLTSKKNENILSKIQYEKLEKMQENNGQEIDNDKTQYIMPYSNIIQIPKNQITFLKWGLEYLNHPEAVKIIDVFYAKLQAKKAIIYDNKGLTKEDMINICKQHDTNIKNKNKHPQTTGQIEALQQAKEKQQQQQEAKKKDKEDKKNKNEEEKQPLKNNNETNTINNE